MGVLPNDLVVTFVIVGVCGTVWAALTLGVYLVEKRRPFTLTPLDPSDSRVHDAPSRKVIEAAGDCGFVVIGTYTDPDPGFRQGCISLLLAPDGLMLLVVHHHKIARRHYLVTQLTTGRRIVTGSLLPYRDITGIDDSAILPTKRFSVLYNYHIERTQPHRADIIPWVPDEAAADLAGHDREWVRRALEAGWIAFKTPEQSIWTFTLKGAIRQYRARWGFFGLSRAAELVKKKEREFGRG